MGVPVHKQILFPLHKTPIHNGSSFVGEGSCREGGVCKRDRKVLQIYIYEEEGEGGRGVGEEGGEGTGFDFQKGYLEESTEQPTPPPTVLECGKQWFIKPSVCSLSFQTVETADGWARLGYWQFPSLG